MLRDAQRSVETRGCAQSMCFLLAWMYKAWQSQAWRLILMLESSVNFNLRDEICVRSGTGVRPWRKGCFICM